MLWGGGEDIASIDADVNPMETPPARSGVTAGRAVFRVIVPDL
jgi:hypothetical protein